MGGGGAGGGGHKYIVSLTIFYYKELQLSNFMSVDTITFNFKHVKPAVSEMRKIKMI